MKRSESRTLIGIVILIIIVIFPGAIIAKKYLEIEVDTIITGIFGSIAIALTAFFYWLSSEINKNTINTLKKIEKSTKGTEEKLNEILKPVFENLLKSFKNQIHRETSDSISTFISIVKNPPILPINKSAVDVSKWANFIKEIHEMEKNKDRFIGVQWLRETKFRDDNDAKQMLQNAIYSGILSKYHVPNPKCPERQVLACKLNRENEFVKQIISVANKD
jgi:hypothetical protein